MENKITVLIADENKDYVEKLQNHFKTDGFISEAYMAFNGESALKKIIEVKPDVVILDSILSAIDGYAIVEEIRKKQLDCKFIMVTGLSSETFVQKAMSVGVDYYMIKPVPPEMILKRIKDIFAIDKAMKFTNETKLNMLVSENEKNSKGVKAIEEKITNIFITVGIPAHIKGYQFLREAIKMAIEQPDIINSITKNLYPSIAQMYDTSASKVERAIRHAIEVAWNRGKIENINAIFGVKVYSNNEKPTNGEFIALVADKMLLEG